MKATNHILSLEKVQWASFYYANQYGEFRQKLPSGPSVHSRVLGKNERAYIVTDVGLILGDALEVATQLKVLDVWVPQCKFQLSSNHTITYTGDKALSLWDTWRAKIFGKKKGNKL